MTATSTRLPGTANGSSTLCPDGSFEHRVEGRAGSRLHYVVGGSGEPLLLVPGWPQTWYAWRKVMPALARKFTVVAVDPPGLGDSDKPIDGYDTQSVANRLHALVESFGWRQFTFVGHDIGCWIGYPFAVTFPDQVRRLVVIDATIPGIVPSEAYAFEPDRISKNWHFFFNAQLDLPEALIAGRERIFLSWLFKAKSAIAAGIEAEAVEEYARHYATPGAWRAGMAYYRALFEDMEQNRAHAHRKRLDMPVLAIGGDAGLGDLMSKMMNAVAQNVTGVVIPQCGHYVPEEAPEQLLEQLYAFLE